MKGRPERRYEDNISASLRDGPIGVENVDWIRLIRDRIKYRGLMNMVMNHMVP
jgi:hypothetical protein